MTEKSENQKPAIDKANLFELKEAVAHDARQTSYPGATDGPADAYRHLLGIAETRRRYGIGVARTVGDLNEFDLLNYGGSKKSDAQMDLNNNRIAEKIGAVARRRHGCRCAFAQRPWTAVKRSFSPFGRWRRENPRFPSSRRGNPRPSDRHR